MEDPVEDHFGEVFPAIPPVALGILFHEPGADGDIPAPPVGEGKHIGGVVHVEMDLLHLSDLARRKKRDADIPIRH